MKLEYGTEIITDNREVLVPVKEKRNGVMERK